MKQAADLLVLFDGKIPVPADADECLARGLVDDPGVAQALKDTKADEPVPGALLSIADACMREVRAAPAFVEAIAGQSSDPLTDEQRFCLGTGYLGMDPAVLEMAMDGALGAEASPEAGAGVASMVADCGVEVGAD